MHSKAEVEVHACCHRTPYIYMYSIPQEKAPPTLPQQGTARKTLETATGDPYLDERDVHVPEQRGGRSCGTHQQPGRHFIRANRETPSQQLSQRHFLPVGAILSSCTAAATGFGARAFGVGVGAAFRGSQAQGVQPTEEERGIGAGRWERGEGVGVGAQGVVQGLEERQQVRGRSKDVGISQCLCKPEKHRKRYLFLHPFGNPLSD